HGDRVTIFGGWGAYEQGWAAVEPCLDWAVSRYSESWLDRENLLEGVDQGIAYSVEESDPLLRRRTRTVGEELAELLRVGRISRRRGAAEVAVGDGVGPRSPLHGDFADDAVGANRNGGVQ